MSSFAASEEANAAKAAALNDVFDTDFLHDITINPEYASQAGFHDLQGGPPLQCCGDWAYTEYCEHSRKVLKEVENVEQMSGNLSSRDSLYLQIFKEMHSEVVYAIESCPLYLLPINSIGAGCPTYSFSESIEWMRFENESDFRRYLARLQHFPTQIEELISCLRKGLETGYVASRAVCRNVAAQLKAIIDGQLDEFYAPIRGGSALLAPHPELLQALESAIESSVRSAYRRFLAFFLESYEPCLREDPSVSALPGGEALYRVCLKYHTTTDLTPDEVHEIGLREVARIEERYTFEVLGPLGFDPDDFAGFVAHVKADPRFYVSTPDQLLRVYERKCEQIGQRMGDYFSDTPRSPLEIVTRNNGPAAFYLTGTADLSRPGRFQVNVSNITERPTYEATALSLHEAIPGHHHQVSLCLENTDSPRFLRYVEDRRYEYCPSRRTMFSAFVEGWALYCEHLGEEMGLYEDPYALYGRLSMDMMRSVRLVVDTGIHHKGWSIERAIKYMQLKTGMHAHEVETEIYRYASWPGQACAYKIGQLEILRLRQQSEERLGPLFDLKEFHSRVLQCPLPLTVLGSVIEDYIQSKLSCGNN